MSTALSFSRMLWKVSLCASKILSCTFCTGAAISRAAGITTTYYPAASEAVIYLMMLVVLVVRPRGLFGEEGLFE